MVFRLGFVGKKLIWLALTMFIAIIVASGAGAFILYQTSLAETTERLIETAKSNARLIETIAIHEENELHSAGSLENSHSDALEQVKKAHENFKFGHTGEFTLAKREGNQIVFLMRNRFSGKDIPVPVLMGQHQRAEPMIRALKGESGWMIGYDYRGNRVLAAYEPVKILDVGLVVKVDIEEVYSPYIRAALIVFASALFLSLLAMFIFYRLSRQISARFEDSSKQFTRLATNAKDAIYRISLPDGHFEYINDAVFDIYGVTPEELYESPLKIKGLLHPDWLDYYEEQWRKLIAGDASSSYEYKIIHESGEERWVSQRNVLITNKEGRVVAVEGIATDTTEVKQYAEHLKLEKEVAQSYLDIVGSMVLAIDKSGSITLFNHKACQVSGYSAGEALGKNWFEHFLPAEVKPKILSLFEQIMSGKTELRPFYENTILNKDGEERIIAWHNTLLKDERGETSGVLSSGEDITEQKQTRERLQLFYDLINMGNDATFVIDPETGCFLEVNHMAAKDLGYSQTSLIGMKVMDIAIVSHGFSWEKLFFVIQQTGSKVFEATHLRKDGSTYPVEISASYITIGEKDFMLASARDISERKRAEKALKESDSKFRAVFESQMIGNIFWDIEGNITDANDSFLAMVGYSRDDLTSGSMHWAEMTPSEFKEITDKSMKELTETGIMTLIEKEFLCKDGSRLPILMGGAFLPGSRTQGISYIIDISERKRAEEAIEGAEKHAKAVIENALDAVVGIDSHGIIFDWNSEAEKMFGYTFAEAVGRELGETIIPPEVRKAHAEGLKRFNETGQQKVLNQHIECSAVHRNGDLIPVELSIVPIQRNHEMTFSSFIRDLSERNRVRDELIKNESTIREGLIGTILAVSKAVEARDPYTAGHQQRVSKLSVAIAQELGLDHEQVEGVRMGALIHDIGKIQLPSEMLSKPNKLTSLEYEIIKSHAEVGFGILSDIYFPWPIANIAHQHHEHIDGTGYPQGLKGDEICIEARIVAVADVVEAISSHRPYRASLGMEAALTVVTDHCGDWYDQDVVNACLVVINEKNFMFSEGNI